VRTLVVGVDGSPDSRRALEWAVQLASETDARVVAVHAVGLLEYEPDDPNNQHLRGQLDQWTPALEQLPAERIERRLVPGDPVDALTAAARDIGADLVVVGSRGTGSHTATSLGSTSLHLAEAGGAVLVIVPAADA
jgi:nucleotide-binding universal stress UspA family protein